MEPLQPGAEAPPIPGVGLDGPRALLFYKVTCPVCQLAAPPAQRLYEAFPDRFAAVGQDPAADLEAFAREFGASFPSSPDRPPYEVSNAYGVRTVPTLFLLDDGRVEDVVESWDRDGWNRVAARLADLAGTRALEVSRQSDGLPSFKPG